MNQTEPSGWLVAARLPEAARANQDCAEWAMHVEHGCGLSDDTSFHGELWKSDDGPGETASSSAFTSHWHQDATLQASLAILQWQTTIDATLVGIIIASGGIEVGCSSLPSSFPRR
jgi:hypothetical protein